MTTLPTFLTDLAEHPHKVEAIVKDPHGSLASSGLSEEDQQLLKSRDWPAIQKKLNESFKPEGLNINITLPVVVVVV